MSADESLLYSLATRLIPRRATPESTRSNLRLLAGEVPDDLPVPLPLPPGAQVIGSVIDGNYVTIVLDTDRTPRQVVTFYEAELPRDGWTSVDTGRSRGGFEQANHDHGRFQAQRGPTLHLNTHAYPDMLTEVRLDLDLSPDQSRHGRELRPAGHAPPFPTLPELAPPVGATLQKMGGEAGPMGTSAQADLTSSLDLGAVATHYAEQMRQAGCVERDRGQGNLVAWSTWEVDDPDHGPSQGLFLALQRVNDSSRYFLYERVAWSHNRKDRIVSWP